MNFDKEIFLDYFKNGNLDESEKRYIYRLYKTYNLVSAITKGQIDKNKAQLREFENKIYNIDGKVFTDLDKVKFSLDAIRNVLKRVNKATDDYDYISDEIDNIIELDLRDEKNISYAKKKISIMQAKLGLNNTFFYEACQVFDEIYTNGLIAYLDKNRSR